jgi:uncharacterized protein (DUF58 family)
MFTADEARVLNRLMLGAGTAAPAASTAALRRARMHGAGLEFQEYRHYEPGDDPRSIDWTVEARLRQLVVRVSRADGHIRLHVIVDASASMGLGRPDKLSCVRSLAGALCYIAQERRDVAGLAIVDTGVRAFAPPAPGRPQLYRALNLLDAMEAHGGSDLDRALRHYGAAARGPGLAIVISDFLGADLPTEGLQYLRHRGLAPALVQVTAREEIDPEFDDDVELYDVEHATANPLIVDGRAVDAYLQALASQQARLAGYCREQNIPLVRLVSDQPFGARLAALQEAGLLSAYG